MPDRATSNHAFRSGRPDAARRRGGFSFAEVLFAVVVLGIGFIMVAGIFPVAIQQSKATQDETAAASAARAAVAELQRLAYGAPTSLATGVLPATGTINGTGVVSAITNPDAWNMIRGTLIVRDDPRYAYVPLYRRYGTPNATAPQADWADTAQIYVIAIECRGVARPANMNTVMNGATFTVPLRVEPLFDLYDIAADTTAAVNPNNIAARPIRVQIEDNYNSSGIDCIRVRKSTPSQPNSPENAVAEGTYVVVSNDTAASTATHTNVTGRIYRVGLRREDLDATDPNYLFYDLQPGSDMQSNLENLALDTDALVVGRERLPGNATAPGAFVGGAQDVSIYTTIIPVKP